MKTLHLCLAILAFHAAFLLIARTCHPNLHDDRAAIEKPSPDAPPF